MPTSRRLRGRLGIGVALTLAASAGCAGTVTGSSTADSAPTQPASASPALVPVTPGAATSSALVASPSSSEPSIDLHHVDWPSVSVPGQFCSVPGSVKLTGGQASASSTTWGAVHLSEDGPVVYGDLGADAQHIAAVPVWCDRGGTAASQVAQAYVVFTATGETAHALRAITAQQNSGGNVHIPYVVGLTISSGTITAHEVWYRQTDPDCCPSGRASTVWTYTQAQLVPGTPQITS